MTQFAEIVRAIQKAIPKNARVVELYGGVATIGAHLLERAARVRCSDENPWNAACVDLLKRGLDGALAEKLSYETAPAAVDVVDRVDDAFFDAWCSPSGF